MDMLFIVSILSTVLTTVSQLPQVIKTIKMKETRDLSLTTLVMLTTGVGFWVIYGFMLNQPPIYIANIITFILSATVLSLKIKFG